MNDGIETEERNEASMLESGTGVSTKFRKGR